MKISQGNLNADKIEYPDGINCCVWYPTTKDGDSGICFDFPYEDIDDFILLLEKLKKIKATVYKES